MWKQLTINDIVQPGDCFARKGTHPFKHQKGISLGHPYVGKHADSPLFFPGYGVWRKVADDPAAAAEDENHWIEEAFAPAPVDPMAQPPAVFAAVDAPRDPGMPAPARAARPVPLRYDDVVFPDAPVIWKHIKQKKAGHGEPRRELPGNRFLASPLPLP